MDILLYNRLYAAEYKDLNDPMEGLYYYHSGKLDESVREKLSGEKEKLKICSLSEANDDILMWSHYADGYKGVVIEVEIDTNKYHLCPIHYDGHKYISNKTYCSDSAREILTHKIDCWSYEKEKRVFSTTNFIDVKITKIIIGHKVKNPSFIRTLVERINPDIRVHPEKNKSNSQKIKNNSK